MNERRKQLEKMTVLKDLAPLAKSYGLDVEQMRKSEIIDAILAHENPPKKTRPPRNHASTKLKAVRVASGLAQRELADRCDLNIRTLQHYEQGSKLIDSARIDTIIKVCIALNCDIPDVLENNEIAELYTNFKAATN